MAGWSGVLLLALWLAGCGSTPPVQPAQPAPPPAVTAPEGRPPRLGLALGGGAARGFAHVGVIQVLEAQGIHPDLIVGTSAGSLVAALYATGRSAAELEKLALSMDEAALTDWSMPLVSRGMLRGEALARFVRQAVDGRVIEQMALPLGILATDLQTGQGVLFRRGDTAQAVRASSAVPGVFAPVSIGGKDYVDGGLVAPVPVRQAREMGAEVVIAVDISADPADIPAGGLFSLLPKTTAIMGQSINRLELASADVVLRPTLPGVGSADFRSRQRSIEAGRAAMQAALPRLKAELARLRVVTRH
ncbi:MULTISPECIES: patatin-like phospholipase family protein [Hydrogenophaga]|uniref:patatin-like phospholipase family protein n=1 Tax=Hydrogenophaga TaxID=47420 RepID=UPI001F2C8BDD|nr:MULTISPECIES: patatin-like phospholipase family protein [Hydrogenophaga]